MVHIKKKKLFKKTMKIMYNTDNQRHLNDEFSPIRMMMIFKKDNT